MKLKSLITEYNPRIFREYDIRGIAETDFNSTFVGKLGCAFGTMLSNIYRERKLKIAVGRDNRASSEKYCHSFIRGVISCGIDVVNIGICPTPITHYAIGSMNLDGGIMITGSHNPAHYNGFKIYIGEETLHGDHITDLKKVYDSGCFIKCKKGKTTNISVTESYIDYICSAVESCKTGTRGVSKVVIDPGNGTAGEITSRIFSAMNHTVFMINRKMDPEFPGRDPDPSKPENLKKLSKAVIARKADIGIAFDIDADRLGIIDNRGRVVPSDEVLMILSQELLERKKRSKIVFDVKCSNRLPEFIVQQGGIPILWKTGHSIIRSKMKEVNADLAGELSGHFFTRQEYGVVDDAIYASALLVRILNSRKKRLSTIVGSFPKSRSTPEINVPVKEEDKFSIVHDVIQQFKKRKFRLNLIDGIRVSIGKSWGLVRASNTQPVLVLRFEAPDLISLKKIRSLVESVLGDIMVTYGYKPINKNNRGKRA